LDLVIMEAYVDKVLKLQHGALLNHASS